MVADDSSSVGADSDASGRRGAVGREAGAELTLGIVHEMNNLAGGIAVLSELYQQGAATGLPMGEGLELIRQSTIRLQTLVGHLKVIHGPLRQEPTYVNVAEFVRSLLETFAPALSKDTVVETDFEPTELVACVDEADFRQALLGLTLNLRDALATRSLPGYGLRASLRRLPGDRAELVLAPTDESGVDIRVEACSAGADARRLEAERAMEELGGRLKRGSHGEYIVELPLVS